MQFQWAQRIALFSLLWVALYSFQWMHIFKNKNKRFTILFKYSSKILSAVNKRDWTKSCSEFNAFRNRLTLFYLLFTTFNHNIYMQWIKYYSRPREQPIVQNVRYFQLASSFCATSIQKCSVHFAFSRATSKYKKNTESVSQNKLETIKVMRWHSNNFNHGIMMNAVLVKCTSCIFIADYKFKRPSFVVVDVFVVVFLCCYSFFFFNAFGMHKFYKTE